MLIDDNEVGETLARQQDDEILTNKARASQYDNLVVHDIELEPDAAENGVGNGAYNQHDPAPEPRRIDDRDTVV